MKCPVVWQGSGILQAQVQVVHLSTRSVAGNSCDPNHLLLLLFCRAHGNLANGYEPGSLKPSIGMLDQHSCLQWTVGISIVLAPVTCKALKVRRFSSELHPKPESTSFLSTNLPLRKTVMTAFKGILGRVCFKSFSVFLSQMSFQTLSPSA